MSVFVSNSYGPYSLSSFFFEVKIRVIFLSSRNSLLLTPIFIAQAFWNSSSCLEFPLSNIPSDNSKDIEAVRIFFLSSSFMSYLKLLIFISFIEPVILAENSLRIDCIFLGLLCSSIFLIFASFAASKILSVNDAKSLAVFLSLSVSGFLVLRPVSAFILAFHIASR